MKTLKTIQALLFGIFVLAAQAQHSPNWAEWVIYYPTNSGLPIYSVTEITIDTNGHKWIGSGGFGEGGLSLYDDENWTLYDNSNAFIGAIDNFITALAVDKENNVYTSTQFDPTVWKYDGNEWNYLITSASASQKVLDIEADKYGRIWIGHEGTGINKPGLIILTADTSEVVYTPNNSNIPSATINSIFFEDNDTSKVWLGGSGHLIFFDGINWTDYNPENSGLPFNSSVHDVIVDSYGMVLMATDNGLITMSQDEWTVYTPQNSPLPDDFVFKLSEDKNNIIWAGLMSGGLVSINGNSWNIYGVSNSPLPSNLVFSLVTDSLNNKWIGTMGGLAVYNEVGVQVTGMPETLKPGEQQLSISPNPIIDKGVVKYNAYKRGTVHIGVYDMHGNLLMEINDRVLYQGCHVFEISMRNYPNGTYIIKSAGPQLAAPIKFVKTG